MEMKFRNFDANHTGELLKHVDRQNEVLMEAYRSMFNELRKLQIEEEMLMRKMHEVISSHGHSKNVDEQEPLPPKAILVTTEEKQNGKTISEELILWKAQPVEEAEAEMTKEKYPSLCLEDKVEIREGVSDGNPFSMVLAQPRSEKPL
ncbi:hypothetical protein VNO78_12973 [Psophocarpus tetragonolobus]|uniref:Uncharacterized protein n=1 Tax=Psophocarpus tetragonolobus TaxID=3891 RepID=A0AAN9SWP4_PSOTE